MLTNSGKSAVTSTDDNELACKEAAFQLSGAGGAYNLPSKLMAAGSVLAGGMVLARAYNQLKNDQRRKTLIEDLYLNDTVLRGVDKATVIEWYATMMHFAPQMSLDKNTVREVLQGFARFGRVDINTLKMLASTEADLVKSKHYAESGWSGIVDNLAKGVTIANGMSVI